MTQARTIILAFALSLLIGCSGGNAATPTTSTAPPATPAASVPPTAATPASAPASPPRATTTPGTPTRIGSPAATPATPLTFPTRPPTATVPPTVPPTVALIPPPPVPGTTLEGQALVAALQRGGFVIFFRHAATDFSQPDADRRNLDNCATQRNLSAQGRADADAIGLAFSRLQLPVGPVLASPYCRTRETAEIAFGRAEPVRDLVSTASAIDEAEAGALVRRLRELLATPPPAGQNTILVGHDFNIRAATDLALAEGEAAIFLPDGAGGYSLVARVTASGWAGLARVAPMAPQARAR